MAGLRICAACVIDGHQGVNSTASTAAAVLAICNQIRHENINALRQAAACQAPCFAAWQLLITLDFCRAHPGGGLRHGGLLELLRRGGLRLC